MNLSTVLRIIVSCLLNAVVAWTVDYYATSLLSRRDVFKTGRKPKIFTVQWLAFTLMLCGFALLPSGLNEVGKFPVICIKAVSCIVLFELLYEGSFLKKLLMAVGHSVIMLGGEFIMSRAFIAAGLGSGRSISMLTVWFSMLFPCSFPCRLLQQGLQCAAFRTCGSEASRVFRN